METKQKPKRKNIRIVVLLIVLAALAIVIWFFGLPLYEEYTPGVEYTDLREYLGLSGVEGSALMLGERWVSSSIIVRSGAVYWDEDSIKRYLVDNFWVDKDDGVLLLTTANEVVRADAGALFYIRHAEAAPAEGIKAEVVETDMPVFFIEGGRSYIALDYVKLFSNFSYELFQEPYRIQIYLKDWTYEGADVLKKTSLRVADDIKSEIICELDIGDTVFILNKMEHWSKVRTENAFVGYVENRRLSEEPFDIEIVIPQDYEPPPYTSLTRDRTICLGWHLIAVMEGNGTLHDRIEPAWPLDVISPTWYALEDGSGLVKSLASKSYVDEAHAQGLEVWPLVDDFLFDSEDPRPERVEMLMSTENRNSFVSYLIEQSYEFGFDGINLDFELVPSDAASGYEQLVRELSVACRAHGLVFSIDNYPPRQHTEYYNRGLQGKVADYVIIMGYDEHWGSGSGVGSVASLPFVIDGIERTLAVVPANKTINAVPFYSRIWSTDHKDGTVRVELTYGQVRQDRWIEERGLEPIWSEELGQYYTQIDENGRTYQVWLENEASMQTRLEAMKGYGLGGVACWQIGLEPPQIWDILGEYTGG